MKFSNLTLSLAAAMFTLSMTGCSETTEDDTTADATPTVTYDKIEGTGKVEVAARFAADDADASTVTLAAATSTPSALAWAASVALPAFADRTDVSVTANISTDTTWTADSQYNLQGQIKVDNNATLTIEAGTVVYGAAGANYMVVLNGSKIIAEGNATDPITFTSEDALNGGAAGQGQWGGLTILGGATTNHTDAVYEVDEDDTDFAFGGTTDTHNGGSLSYVRILNSGYTVATDLEINGLSLCGVGTGTTIDNIYVADSSDDGIEIWGGTVNLSNIEIYNAGDDSYDLDYGYTGTTTNLIVEQGDAAHAGMEISSGGTSPLTSPIIKNFIVTTVDASDEGGIYLKDDTTAPTFINGTIVMGGSNAHGAIRAKKVLVDAAKVALQFSDINITEGSNEIVDGDGADFALGALYANNTKLAWADSVALPSSTGATSETVTGTLSGTVNWTADTQYKLSGQVKVASGATLNIAAGTVVYGDAGANYLVVLAGGTINADGNATDPITFTSTAALAGGDAGQGQWGGLTILGNATTNHTTPFYEVDEDDSDFAFGGSTDTDNSGSLSYVRILNSGYTVATDLEINGLSLCGVGTGTTIDNIYVADSSDDGIEIWGGTVDLSNIEIFNAGDDSLDLDYGYTGTVSNVTVEQGDAAHAGMEISSGGSTPMTSPTIINFNVTTVADSDEGGIYLKDDTTAPTFINGLVYHNGDDEKGVIYAKKTPTTDAEAALAFKNVTLEN